jgi:hypothetical protein
LFRLSAFHLEHSDILLFVSAIMFQLMGSHLNRPSASVPQNRVEDSGELQEPSKPKERTIGCVLIDVGTNWGHLSDTDAAVAEWDGDVITITATRDICKGELFKVVLP